MNVLVSACLLGCACRYDGKSKPCDKVISLMERHVLIPVCPEIYGGLSTPRSPSEIVGNRVINSDGKDITSEYEKGANEALNLAKKFHCDIAVLKAKSPSCGKGRIYDGTFSGRLTDGNGVTAKLLIENGICVYTEEEIDLF